MTDLPKCFDKKDIKNHKGDYLKEIYRFGYEDHEQTVVQWCSECGAIVIDGEYDGRRTNSIVKMKFPKTLSSILK